MSLYSTLINMPTSFLKIWFNISPLGIAVNAFQSSIKVNLHSPSCLESLQQFHHIADKRHHLASLWWTSVVRNVYSYPLSLILHPNHTFLILDVFLHYYHTSGLPLHYALNVKFIFRQNFRWTYKLNPFSVHNEDGNNFVFDFQFLQVYEQLILFCVYSRREYTHLLANSSAFIMHGEWVPSIWCPISCSSLVCCSRAWTRFTRPFILSGLSSVNIIWDLLKGLYGPGVILHAHQKQKIENENMQLAVYVVRALNKTYPVADEYRQVLSSNNSKACS